MIILAEYEDLEAISILMHEVFHAKMESYYDEEGRKVFLQSISPASLQKRYFEGHRFYTDAKRVGVLELEPPCHIAYLLVKEEGKGVGRALCEHVLNLSKEAVCTVGAFPMAAGFYKRLGFVKVSDEKKAHGMPFVLMAKYL